MKKVIVCIFAVLSPWITFAGLIYHFDFEDYPVDSQFVPPAGVLNSGSNAYIRTVGDVEGMSGQMLVLDGVGNSIGFTADLVVASVVTISWDMVALSGVRGPSISIGGRDANENPVFHFNVNYSYGYILDSVWGQPYPNITTTSGVADHFEFIVDMFTDAYTFSINGVIVEQGSANGVSPTQVGFGGAYMQEPTYAIDNFQWEVTSAIPEPTGISLLFLGGAFLLAKVHK